MGFTKLLRRELIVAIMVALAAAIVMFILNDWLCASFTQNRLLSALGTACTVFLAFIAQRVVSLALYRDYMMGHYLLVADRGDRLDSFNMVATEVSAELKQIGDFNEIMRNQLHGVIEYTEKAAFDIVTRLQAIDTVITQLEHFVNATSIETSQITKDSERRIAQNHTLISEMDRYIHERLHIAKQDQIRVQQVVQEADALESLVQLVKQVAEQTNLLALNAAIEAAREGESGRGFAVVADQIRKLSTETEGAVNKISQGINSVTGTIRTQFEQTLSNTNFQKEKMLLDHFSSQLNELGQNYESLMRHEASVLTEVENSSQKLSGMFMEAQASIQFQDISRQQIEIVANALTVLDEHTNLLANRLRKYEDKDISYTPLAQHLESIYSKYVMEEQRVNHQHTSAAKMDTPLSKPALIDPAGTRIELF